MIFWALHSLFTSVSWTCKQSKGQKIISERQAFTNTYGGVPRRDADLERDRQKGSHAYNELVEALLGEGAREQEAAEQEKSGGAEELHETGRPRHGSGNGWPGLLPW